MIKVKNAFRYGTPPTSFEGFIDLEDLKYEI